MTLPQEVSRRIFQESIAIYPPDKKNRNIRGAKISAYRDGANKEAERSISLIKALRKSNSTIAYLYRLFKETEGFGLIEVEISKIVDESIKNSNEAITNYANDIATSNG